MVRTEIKPNQQVFPQVYAYVLMDERAVETKGWVKIGYTERKDVEQRIREQAGPKVFGYKKLWNKGARNTDGQLFTDHDFHRFIVKRGIERNTLYGSNEWFYFNGTPEQSLALYKDFVVQDFSYSKTTGQTYQLRAEQEEAVQLTKHFFENEGKEFLWNAKPRFGKTLASYDLARQLEAVSVLIVTNRPAIANSWFDDFEKFIAGQTNYLFVSESESLKGKETLSREEYQKQALDGTDHGQIAFVSLQDLKGSKYFGDGPYDKLKWVSDTKWDLLIIDEAHEGIDTFKTDKAFNRLTRKWTLHLSGTPFKALSSDKFFENQVYTWSYEDEQKAKKNWQGDGYNPYGELPTLNLFTYQLSQMMIDKVNQGAQLDSEEVPYYFDLNEFFAVGDNGKFIYEADVLKFLDSLTTHEKYPFSTEKLRNELKHTFWLLNRVASAKALEKLLKAHPVFSAYEVIIAAGDGKNEADVSKKNEASLARVLKAIEEHDKTITLSVGQLTTGITVKPWSAVMMLSNIKSPSLYMQAAFRAQNAYQFQDENGELYRKENAYIFDFAPERTLILFDEFANNLKSQISNGKGTRQERQGNVQELLNFLPVIAEDSQGRMVELDAEKVLTIPHKLKATEVVRHGFMSNFLFANISGIFQAPPNVLETLNRLEPAHEEKKTAKKVDTTGISVDENGQIEVAEELVINKTEAVFTSEKIVEAEKQASQEIEKLVEPPQENFIKTIARKMAQAVVPELNELQDKKQFDKVNKSDIKRMTSHIEQEVYQETKEKVFEFDKKQQVLKQTYESKVEQASTEQEKAELRQQEEKELETLFQGFKEETLETVKKASKEAQKEAVREQEVRQEERKKQDIENDIRDHLRGFSRTIPSFIMAYGDRELTLKNFDSYTPHSVFKEVTGISIAEFLFLRDGGDYEDENGDTKHYKGQLFDETVFNQSIQEFLDLKEKLANYFDEEQEEDIFDYIPLQKTNQKFTPRKYVKLMVDSLQEESPAIFDSSQTRFFDPYVKSGLFLTEIAKKLYASPALKEEFPDSNERIRHILQKQVFGAAPTEIIYQIAKTFVYGQFPEMKDQGLRCLDLLPAAKDGSMTITVTKEFEEEKMTEKFQFDAVIGNPPYQEENKGDNRQAQPIYHLFMEEAYKISDVVSFITPARFLFNPSRQLSAFSKKCLLSPHFKVNYFEQDSSKIFPTTDIKGGLVISYRDVNKMYEPIEVFTAYEELSSILKKVKKYSHISLSKMLYSTETYRFTDTLFTELPQLIGRTDKQHEKAMASSVFSRYPEIFFDKVENKDDYVQIYGKYEGKRISKYVKRVFVNSPENLNLWKVFIPGANGSGAIGEVLSTPLIGEPLIGHTQTFISIGAFETELEAQNLMTYIKSKFARAMLGIKKVTQNNQSKETWSEVPLQDFTAQSDIDWSQSIAEIDQQLYRKYGLSQEEIDFIEEKVRSMD